MKDVRLEISSCSGCPFESGQTFFAKRPEGSVASSFQRTSCCHSTYRFQTRINQFKSYPDSVLFRKPLAGTIENVICGFTPMVSCLNQKNVTSCLIKSVPEEFYPRSLIKITGSEVNFIQEKHQQATGVILEPEHLFCICRE